MITEDQTGVIDFLAAPSTHGGEVERIDTHDPWSFSRVRAQTEAGGALRRSRLFNVCAPPHPV